MPGLLLPSPMKLALRESLWSRRSLDEVLKQSLSYKKMVPYSIHSPKPTQHLPAGRNPKGKSFSNYIQLAFFRCYVSFREGKCFFFLGAYLISQYGWAVWFCRFVLEPLFKSPNGFLRFIHWIRNQIWTRRFAISSKRLEATKWWVYILYNYIYIYLFLDKYIYVYIYI